MTPSTPEPARRQGMDYGESEEVQQVHAAVQREKQEPRVGLEPLSIWLIAVYSLAIFFGGAYLGRFSGNFSGDSLDPYAGEQVGKKSTGPQGQEQTQELTPTERGKKVFSANCAVCHQASGIGSPTQGYPPLVGSEYTNGGSRRNAMIVLKGLQGPLTVKGQKFGSAVMQPWETLGDQKVADVLTYVRSEWGNTGSPVSKEQVSALRKELVAHSASFTEADLLAAPNDDLTGGEANAAKPGAPPAGSPSPNPPGAQPPKP